MARHLLAATAPFPLFGPSHAAVLVLSVILAAVLVRGARPPTPEQPQRATRLALGAAIFFGELAFALFPLLDGTWDVRWALPLHLCDLAAFLALPALATLHPFLVEVLFYWGCTGTLLATLTPELQNDFPHIEFFCFFASHALVVVAAVYLVFGLRIRPRPRSWLPVWLAILGYGVAIAFLNRSLGANYLFLCHKPGVSSPFDYLGPWPWYIVAVHLGFLALMVALECLLGLTLGSPDPDGPRGGLSAYNRGGASTG